MLLPLLYHVSPASARSFRSVFSVAFFLPPCYIKNVEYLFFSRLMAPPPLFRRLFFCPLHTERPLRRTGFFRIELYSNLYGQTDEEILTFLFRSTFFPTLRFFRFISIQIKRMAARPRSRRRCFFGFSRYRNGKRLFPVCCSFFPLASFKLESLLFPEDAPNVQLVGQQVETLLPT